MTSTNKRQNELYDRFKQHSKLPSDHLELFRYCIVDFEYHNRKFENDESDSTDEDDFDIVQHYNADGSEYTLADVPLRSLVDAIEEHIQTYIPEHRRTEVYKKVVEGVHGIKQTPKWDRVDNPRAKPQTPFSESRAPLKFRQTNELLFEDFGETSKLSRETLARIRGMIVWRDSERSNGTWGAIEWDTFQVTGGRLGPTEQHTLSDVPHCYVRDRLMASIAIDVDQNRRDLVRETIFSDLTLSQIKEYASAIEEMERQVAGHKPAKTERPRRSREVFDRAQRVREIQYSRKISPQEAECIMKQEELLDAIDDTIDLAPSLDFTARGMNSSEFRRAHSFMGMSDSVLTPGARVQEDEEVSLPDDCTIDRDCDQVRAMIKIFSRSGHWTMEQFTRALDGPRRREVSKFLEQRGPLGGKQSAVFRKSWEFFKKRELLGFELTAPPPKPKLAREVRGLLGLREVDPNRGRKRPNLGDLDRSGKLSKTSKT
ncbi:hypothetical protein O1611_g4627 [Lasiodiplodia mahajangana]|uniref:Uncharacterized protein n=1 Tax=Lasiodiplodia mahajangana TaxID=1108764 RepID=A0ACC2JNB0_9PEZI|nr:hypothetical protein O1611_g4627 [Lasiodiplodia mahajangana]